MEKTDLVLGIDTSCYTTSAALMDGTGALLFDERRLLRVKEGRRGLSQSEMVFQHMRALPDLLERIDLTQGRLSAIVASERPRPLKESYMPAFLVGWGMARSLSHFMDVPLIAATHQHNHMFAGLWGLRRRPPARSPRRARPAPACGCSAAAPGCRSSPSTPCPPCSPTSSSS